jgi:hypothetical protein
MAESALDLAIVLVSWNTRELLLNCLEALPAALGDLDASIWVVDNGSADGTVAAVLAQFPAVQLLVNARNVGFAAANNQAIQASRSRYVLLLNSDTIATPGSIAQLVAFADQQPRAGIVGGRLVNPDGSFQASFADAPSLRSELLSSSGLGPRLYGRWYPSYGPRRSQATRRVDYIPGACMLTRRSALAEVGLMDEDYFMYSEETDWCLRMWRAGWEVWYLPAARIVHYGGQSTRQMRQAMVRALYRSKVRFFRKHYGALSAAALRAIFVAVSCTKWLAQRMQAIGRDATTIEPPLRWRDLDSAPVGASATPQLAGGGEYGS